MASDEKNGMKNMQKTGGKINGKLVEKKKEKWQKRATKKRCRIVKKNLLEAFKIGAKIGDLAYPGETETVFCTFEKSVRICPKLDHKIMVKT